MLNKEIFISVNCCYVCLVMMATVSPFLLWIDPPFRFAHNAHYVTLDQTGLYIGSFLFLAVGFWAASVLLHHRGMVNNLTNYSSRFWYAVARLSFAALFVYQVFT